VITNGGGTTMRISNYLVIFGAALIPFVGAFSSSVRANDWDAVIANTHWYVPTPQLLAYASPRTGFSSPVPIGDQTIWDLDDSVDGAFTGISTAQLKVGPITTVSETAIQGLVTPAGQIRMIFTP